MNGLRYSPEDKKRIEAKIEAGVSASTKEATDLLRGIHETAYDLNIPGDKKLAIIMAWLATLVVSLSIKADRIQKWMVILTVGIGVMTLVLLVGTFILIRIASHTDERVGQIYGIAQEYRNQNEKTNTSTPKIDGISRRPVLK